MRKRTLEELQRLSVEDFRTVEKMPVVLVLDNIRSLHNVGSAFRTADAFRIEKVYLTGITGVPPHREIHKTALGAEASVAWEYEADGAALTARLKAEGYQIVVAEQTTASIPLQEFRLHEGARYGLVFGNEINGVSEGIVAAADQAIEVPQAGTKHSLNISVCVGVVLWELFRESRWSKGAPNSK